MFWAQSTDRGYIRAKQFSTYGRNSHLWLYEPSLWPWTWKQQANQSSFITLWPMMMHHPYQAWLQKVQQLRRYRPDDHSLEFWTFPVTLTLTTTEQSNLTQSSLWWWCAIRPASVTKGSAVQKICTTKNHILTIWSFTVTSTPKTENKSFWKTIWLITMHHHTKFGSKRFRDSEFS